MSTILPAGEGRGRNIPPPAGHIPCCICLAPIPLDEYRTARCWADPAGITCAAHAACLIGVGERDLGLV
jgi:hypothetical protein